MKIVKAKIVQVDEKEAAAYAVDLDATTRYWYYIQLEKIASKSHGGTFHSLPDLESAVDLASNPICSLDVDDDGRVLKAWCE